MILRDDSFSSIVAAVEQGRTIFDNIRKFVIYLLSCNISEILIVSVASLTAMPLPLLPLQILYLNLITDVFPAFALGVGEGTQDIMQRPPRDPKERIVTRDHWMIIGIYGVLITLSVLAAYILAFQWLHAGEREAVTISFLTLAFAQLWHVFNIRAAGRGLLRNEVVQNPYVWGALVLCTGLILAAVETPIVAEVLDLVTPRRSAWLLVLGFSVLPVVLGSAVRKLMPDRAFP